MKSAEIVFPLVVHDEPWKQGELVFVFISVWECYMYFTRRTFLRCANCSVEGLVACFAGLTFPWRQICKLLNVRLCREAPSFVMSLRWELTPPEMSTPFLGLLAEHRQENRLFNNPTAPSPSSCLIKIRLDRRCHRNRVFHAWISCFVAFHPNDDYWKGMVFPAEMCRLTSWGARFTVIE